MISPLREPEIEEAISDGNVRGLQILQLAFTAGVILFSAVVVFLTFSGAAGNPEAPVRDEDGMPMGLLLSAIHVFITISSWTMGGILFAASVRRMASALADSIRDTTDQDAIASAIDHVALPQLRGAWILRLAMREGAALFGAVTCLICSFTGALESQPLYWLNLLGPVFLVVFSVLTFPTSGSLASHIKKALENEAMATRG